MRSRDWQIVPLVVSFALALVVLGPALAPGFVLTYDMVFVPDLTLLPATWGEGSALPRAVPSDALVAVLDQVVPGALLQKAVLLASLTAAGAGAARLLASRPLWVRLAAVVLAVWNPYVAERLVIGQWVLLVGYAALSWVVVACADWLRGRPGSAGRVVLASAVAAVGATGGLLAAGAVAVVALWPGRPERRHAPLVLAGVAAVNAPWVLAGLAHAGAATGAAEGVSAFAPRSEHWAGALVTLLGGGGIWNAGVVPGSRGAPMTPVLTACLLALAVTGLVHAARCADTRVWVGPVAVWAGGAMLVACLTLLPGGSVALSWLVESVPGGGLLRDGQKLVAPFVLATAVLAPCGAEALARGRRPVVASAVATAVLLVPVAALPDLAWGAQGRLSPVEYPRGWAQARAVVAADGRDSLVSLPFQSYRAFGWNASRPVLDPAGRYFPVPTVVDDTLVVAGTPVPGEVRRAARVGAALEAGEPLADLGVRWLFVDRSTPGEVPAAALEQAALRLRDGSVELWEVIGPVRQPDFAPGRPWLAATGHLLAGSVLVGVSVSAFARRRGASLLLFGRFPGSEGK